MVFCFFCLFVRVSCTIRSGLELLGTGRVSRFLTFAFLCSDKVFADIEKVSHKVSRFLIMAQDLIKEREDTL
jgi:hypothetical protein